MKVAKWSAIGLIIVCSASLVACASLDDLATYEQRAEIQRTTWVLVDNKDLIREAIDNKKTHGAIVFTNNVKGTVEKVLPGDSVLDAWIQFVVQTHSGPVDKLPLPSSISNSAAFVYAQDQSARNRLLSMAELDYEISRYYDLSRAMTQLGSDIQDLRDITILLSRSAKAHKRSVEQLHKSFQTLSTKFGALAEKLKSLQEAQTETKKELVKSFDDLNKQLVALEKLIKGIK